MGRTHIWHPTSGERPPTSRQRERHRHVLDRFGFILHRETGISSSRMNGMEKKLNEILGDVTARRVSHEGGSSCRLGNARENARRLRAFISQILPEAWPGSSSKTDKHTGMRCPTSPLRSNRDRRETRSAPHRRPRKTAPHRPAPMRHAASGEGGWRHPAEPTQTRRGHARRLRRRRWNLRRTSPPDRLCAVDKASTGPALLLFLLFNHQRPKQERLLGNFEEKRPHKTRK
jgi:hypothetical protein